MRILAFSDWRVQSIDELINFVKSLDKKPDVIVYGGDDVNRFGDISKEDFIEHIIKNIESNRKESFELKFSDKFLLLGFKDTDLNSINKLKQVINKIKKLKNQYGDIQIEEETINRVSRSLSKIIPKKRVYR